MDDDHLAPVIPLRGRHEDDLPTRLREALADTGSVTEDLVPGAVLPTVWRTAARRAARDLQRPVRTGQVDHDGTDIITVWAGLTDWPHDAAEDAITQASMRRTVDAMAKAFPIPPVGPTAG